MSWKVGYAYNHTVTTETVTSKTDTSRYDFASTVGSNKSLVSCCVGNFQKYSVPWTATARTYYEGLQQPIDELIHGTLSGVSVSNIKAVYANAN